MQKGLQVALVNMPFGPLFLPSIGIGLLKAGLAKQGIEARDFHFTLQFAERIGTHQYLKISSGLHSTYDLLGEWIFAGELFGRDSEREQKYIDQVLRGNAPQHRKSGATSGGEAPVPAPEVIQALVALRDQREFLEECASRLLEARPRIVGFTSVFQQNVASLALAKILKERAPSIKLVMGGANCEGLMGAELIKRFPFLDAVVSGEADLVFPGLVDALLQGRSVSHLAGVHVREDALRVLSNQRPAHAPVVEEMDALPIPDYSEFFEQMQRSRDRLTDAYQPHILFETSRGCYWGKVAHCTFCGLNGNTMAFRKKSPERAMEELIELTGRHPGSPVTVVDNILDMGYFQTFIPSLAARNLGLDLFYEVKANLKKEHVRLLRDAGIRAIQPGLESLSTPILQQMRKGCTRLQNIQILKWCEELGVRPVWNILWGFPGEAAGEYEQMAELIPLLTHLAPPQVAAPLRLDRFSPYFDHAAEFGCTDVRPYPSYELVYDLPPEAVKNLAYFFTFEYASGQDPNTYTPPLHAAIEKWKSERAQAACFVVDLGSCALLYDHRDPESAASPFFCLDALQRTLYLACDAISGIATLRKAARDAGFHVSQEQVEDALHPLLDSGYMLREGNSFLALAVILGEYRPAKSLRETFCQRVREWGEPAGDFWRVGKTAKFAALARPECEPHALALSADHFRHSDSGDVLVNLDSLERIDLNAFRRQMTGVRF